ncbi:MAG: lysine--tRNA ligase [Candidatus Colwellbacteria bacterium RIFCSPHIGHO2_12_FULL_43_12]|uniref:Lysine--tRNA ligase n=2 Tax=Candidatus Colwelliibacteriota TaxID=1817904 RepID=A0A1G1YY05_9BACT|nr:MAG: lysine--tRNA ligase [Candidatus Colwellbacteria bacterium RIFCSPHIGHO2_02_FULL_43_15]OGY59025.1 MAG: lysine--tRNA ligase [Candidatus Colwellbacteria bacterium RIFCSPHIGHO2_12_FULL_43_12]
MIDSLIEERKKKLKNIKDRGIDPYPAEAKRTHTIAEALDSFNKLSKAKKKVYLVGRIRGWRDQGGVIFGDLKDESGTIQLVFKKENLKTFDFWKNNLDLGDFVEVGGPLFKTKKGQESLEVISFKLLVKSLRPVPSEFYGLADVETKLRKRYLDLLSSEDVKAIFIKKSVFWQSFRRELINNGFLEVETPVLESIPGGADAEPFVTHHNALNEDFYLRIALEISLKKLMVGGYEKVFEIGRVFRNEGIDAEHLQDYTALEFYWAYVDYNDLMKFIERLYKLVIKGTVGTLTTNFKGQKINWGKKWPKVDYYSIFKEKIGLDLNKATDQELLDKALSMGLEPDRSLSRGRLVDLLFKKVRHTLVQPCFLINPPADIEPLAKRINSEPGKVARFQVVAGGTELGKGFSEANDPMDQRTRFEEQMKLRDQGDKEAQRLDEDFLEALEYGMPPTAGFGVSERLFAVLMDKPIRETVFFPSMRNK